MERCWVVGGCGDVGFGGLAGVRGGGTEEGGEPVGLGGDLGSLGRRAGSERSLSLLHTARLGSCCAVCARERVLP